MAPDRSQGYAFPRGTMRNIRLFFACVLTLSASLVGCGDEGGDPIDRSRTVLDDVNDVQRDANYAYCDCTTTPDECRANVDEQLDVSELEQACRNEAYRANVDTLGAYFDCGIAALEDQLTCFEGASCDEANFQTCSDTAETALDACAADLTEDAFDQFQADIDACVAEEIVGPAGMCPEETASGTGTILNVSTERRGNDFDPSCSGLGAADVSVEWTAPTSGRFLFSTEGSSFDTGLAVYDACVGGRELICNDDAGGESYSEFVLEVTEGTTYIIVIDGFDANAYGDAVLSVEPFTG